MSRPSASGDPGERWDLGWRTLFLAVGVVCAAPALSAENPLQISQAWVPAAEKTGVDLPLLMIIKNDTATPDALLRVRCPFANFSEKHTVDRGEGAPAKRAISSIPIPAGKTVELREDGYHVMLLQIRQKLEKGHTLTCSVTFEKAGLLETEVHVKGAD